MILSDQPQRRLRIPDQLNPRPKGIGGIEKDGDWSDALYQSVTASKGD